MSMMESRNVELKFIGELCDGKLIPVASLKRHLVIPGQCHLGPLSHSNALQVVIINTVTYMIMNIA